MITDQALPLYCANVNSFLTEARKLNLPVYLETKDVDGCTLVVSESMNPTGVIATERGDISADNLYLLTVEGYKFYPETRGWEKGDLGYAVESVIWSWFVEGDPWVELENHYNKTIKESVLAQVKAYHERDEFMLSVAQECFKAAVQIYSNFTLGVYVDLLNSPNFARRNRGYSILLPVEEGMVGVYSFYIAPGDPYTVTFDEGAFVIETSEAISRTCPMSAIYDISGFSLDEVTFNWTISTFNARDLSETISLKDAVRKVIGVAKVKERRASIRLLQ